jgi:hypothetical protein
MSEPPRPGPDMSGAAIAARLREVARLADLRRDQRLHAKVDMSAAGIERRIRTVSQMLALCRRLARGGGATG